MILEDTEETTHKPERLLKFLLLLNAVSS